MTYYILILNSVCNKSQAIMAQFDPGMCTYYIILLFSQGEGKKVGR